MFRFKGGRKVQQTMLTVEDVIMSDETKDEDLLNELQLINDKKSRLSFSQRQLVIKVCKKRGVK